MCPGKNKTKEEDKVRLEECSASTYPKLVNQIFSLGAVVFCSSVLSTLVIELKKCEVPFNFISYTWCKNKDIK